ncbi:hypothetical protein BC940DRAFT_320675 [Gongronella butleri]|nr:hypothetical protein BC940DRAFT_320675 [Gongronella butleri]
MRFGSLLEELDSITKDYDYGIVPGSAAVFVKDEIMGIGRLDMTLLEGLMIVVEVSNQGYMIASSTPLSDDAKASSASERIQEFVDQRWFETMEDLLMTASPMFRDRFQATLYDKLQQVQQQQLDGAPVPDGSAPAVEALPHDQQQSPILYSHANDVTLPPNTIPSHPSASFDDTSKQQQDFMDELNQWIH